jgi:hypothetical protein
VAFVYTTPKVIARRVGVLLVAGLGFEVILRLSTERVGLSAFSKLNHWKKVSSNAVVNSASYLLGRE